MQENEKDTSNIEISEEDFRQIIVDSIRLGTWMYHQAKNRESIELMITALYKKNYPDSEVPEDLSRKLYVMKDESTGLRFSEIIGQSLMDDWANDETTVRAQEIINAFKSIQSTEKLAYELQKTVTLLEEHYKQALPFHHVMSEALN